MKFLPQLISARRTAAWAIIAICGLNLNGFFNMLFGIDQAFSPLLLLASIFLFLKFRRGAVTNRICLWYVGAILVYVLFSALFSIFSEAEEPLRYIFTYFSSLAVVLAMVSYFSSQRLQDEVDIDLGFLKIILLLATASVWFSRLLFSLYVNPPADTDRYSGLFGNANEAGIISVIAFAMVLARPTKRLWLHVMQIVMICGAAFLTFSKSSILLLFVVFCLYAIVARKRVYLFLLPLIIAAFTFSFPMLLDNVSGLSLSQESRIDQIKAVVGSGELSSDTTTGRTWLWVLAVHRIFSAFPVPSGFGAFHHMVGGIREFGVWQGCHNTYLMVLGEAGFVALAVLILANAKLLAAAFKNRALSFLLLYAVILQWDMLSAHNVLALRFHNMITGCVIGLLGLRLHARTESSSW